MGNSITEESSDRLWRLAYSLERRGKVHTALAVYLSLVECCPKSVQAALAPQRLLKAAEDFDTSRQP